MIALYGEVTSWLRGIEMEIAQGKSFSSSVRAMSLAHFEELKRVLDPFRRELELGVPLEAALTRLSREWGDPFLERIFSLLSGFSRFEAKAGEVCHYLAELVDAERTLRIEQACELAPIRMQQRIATAVPMLMAVFMVLWYREKLLQFSVSPLGFSAAIIMGILVVTGQTLIRWIVRRSLGDKELSRLRDLTTEIIFLKVMASMGMDLKYCIHQLMERPSSILCSRAQSVQKRVAVGEEFSAVFEAEFSGAGDRDWAMLIGQLREAYRRGYALSPILEIYERMFSRRAALRSRQIIQTLPYRVTPIVIGFYAPVTFVMALIPLLNEIPWTILTTSVD